MAARRPSRRRTSRSATRSASARRASSLGMDVLNLFDQKTVINKFMTQLASGQSVVFSESDFYAGKVDFGAAAAAARPGSALPAAERLPAAARDSLQRPVLVLESRADETGSTAGPGFLWSRVRFPGRATLGAGAALLRTPCRDRATACRRMRAMTGFPLTSPGVTGDHGSVHPAMVQAATVICCCCCSARFTRNLRARVLTEQGDH